ncbi:MAG: tRNA (guanosine(46)-N7)-methyltransferase TrmB [Ruminococcaceae bacterium]|nr:tRNA (guanosine(46)-N7)-methyltransferase TrmB [Oscillospiraceae bacterium]
MRMRRKKHRDERYENCIDLAIESFDNIKSLKDIFHNDNPIHIEIGCGKGRFMLNLAKLNPDINYIAIEKSLDVIIMAMEKIKESGITNVKFFAGDVEKLREKGYESEVARIYVNFCDPWKKSGQAKRRLTHANYLSLYEKLLKENGELFFKTDNRKLFEFSLNSFAAFPLKMQNISLDLHNSGYEGNIMTEYEENFSSQGFPIFRCECVFNIKK